MGWKVSPRRWAELWFEMLGMRVTHVSSAGCEQEYCWTCPVCEIELKTGIIDAIEQHLIEDQQKGIIK